MISALKKRNTAVAVTAVVVILSVLLGMRVSMGRRYSKLNRVFADNTDGSGMGVGYYLEKIDKNAGDLVSALSSADADVSELKRARGKLSSAGSAAEKYEAYREVCDAASALTNSLDESKLNYSQQNTVRDCAGGITSGSTIIEKQALVYNELAENYNSELKKFPLSLFRYVLFLSEAEEFK